MGEQPTTPAERMAKSAGRKARGQRRVIWRVHLRPLRLGLGLSLAEVAQELGICVSHLSLIELGRSEPSFRLAWRISQFFGKSMNEIWLAPAEEKP